MPSEWSEQHRQVGVTEGVDLPTTTVVVRNPVVRGLRRLAMLEDRLNGGSYRQTSSPDLRTWVQSVLGLVKGEPLGLDPTGIPLGWRWALRRCGMPFALPGQGWRWLQDVQPGPGPLRLEPSGRLLLPPLADLKRLNGIALRPLRAFVADRTRLRLQVGPRIAFFLWPRHALLISLQSVPVGGFLHGPEPSQRHSLALDPGQGMLLAW